MSSLFTKIIKGEIPTYKIYENDRVFVFLDIYPISLGHTLIISKTEIDQWTDLPLEDYLAIQTVAQKIGNAIKKATNCKRIGQIVDGREIPHCHLHLIPLVDGQAINQKSEQKLIAAPTPQEFANLQSQIIKNLK